MIRHRLCLALFISVFTVGLLVPLLRPGTAAAEGEQYAWIDNNNIRISAGDLSAPATAVYNESANFAGLRVFQANAAHNSGCSLYLEVLVGFTQGEVVSSRVTAPAPPSSSGGNCSAAIRQTYQNKTITIAGNPGGAPASMVNYNVKVWSPKTFDESPATIVLQSKTSAGQNITSVTTPKNKADAGTDGSGNQVSEAAFYLAQLLLFKGSSYQLCSNDSSILTCTPFTVPADYAGAIDEFNTRPNFGAIADAQKTCRGQIPGDIGWLACPIITTAADAAEKLSEFIVNLLKLDTNTIFQNPETSSAYHSAWAGFRNIAYAIMVVFGLIMVASQVFNLEIFDAYILRKMLPKLILAIIFVTISWNLMEFIYNLSNDAADAVMDIIRAPFQGVSSVKEALNGPVTLREAVGNIIGNLGLGVAGVAAGVAAVAAIGYAALGGGLVILSLIASLALGLLSVFILLAARNVASYLAVIVAPIFIILKAFGPTEKAGTAWQALVVALVLSVPGAAAVLETTGIAALIAGSSNSAIPAIPTITAFVILIAGFALLWTLFLQMDKITGFMGNVANKVTGRAQKALSNYRSNTMKRNMELWKRGSLNNFMGRRTRGLGSAIGAAQTSVQASGAGAVSSFMKARREISRQGADVEAADEMLKRDKNRFAGFDEINEEAVRLGVGATRGQLAQALVARFAKSGEVLSLEDANKYVNQYEQSFGGRVGTTQFTIAAAKAAAASSTAYREEKWRTTDEAIQSLRDSMHGLVANGAITSTQAAAIMTSNKTRLDLAGAGFAATMQYIDGKKNLQQFKDSFVSGNNAYSMYGQRWETARAGAQHMKSQLDDLFEAMAAPDGAVKDTLIARLRDRGLMQDRTGKALTIEQSLSRLLAEVDSGYQVAKTLAPLNAQYLSDILLSYQPAGSSKPVNQLIVERKRTDPEMERYGYEFYGPTTVGMAPPGPIPPGLMTPGAPPGAPGAPPPPPGAPGAP